MSILLLGGSPSVPSSSSRLLLHIGEKLAAQGHRYQRVHVRDLPARALLLGDGTDTAIRRATDAVAAAHAIVIATPIYKASYSGVLKAFLDLLPQDGLAGKIILPIATGGSQSHMLALDYALRPVLHALAARQVLTGIYATSQQLQWHDEEGLSLAAPIAARVAAGVEELASALAPLQRARLAAAVSAATSASSALASSSLAAPVRSLQDHPYTPSTQAA